MKILPPYDDWSIMRDPETKWACLVVKNATGTGVSFKCGASENISDFAIPEAMAIPERPDGKGGQIAYAALELLRKHVNSLPKTEEASCQLKGGNQEFRERSNPA